MKKLFYILMIAGGCLAAQTLQAQTIEQILGQVEENNASLEARRRLTSAQSLEARTGNSLPDPEVGYEYKWGNRSELGNSGELSLVQEFDFPSVYANRSKLAKIREQQYGYEYEAFRKEILLEAQALCIEILTLREQGKYLLEAMNGAEQVAAMFARKMEKGDASVLESNKANFEMVAAKNTYGQNQIELSTAENMLANLNGGMPLAPGDEAWREMEIMAAKLPPMERMLEIYESTHPELQAIICEQSAAERDVRLSRSQSMPKLSLGYKYEYATGRERFNGVVAGMSIPIFANRNNVKRAKAQYAYAGAEAARARLDMRASLERLYASAELMGATLAGIDAIDGYEDAANALIKALEAGHISVTDYYSELRPIYENMLTRKQLWRDYMTTVARIESIGL